MADRMWSLTEFRVDEAIPGDEVLLYHGGQELEQLPKRDAINRAKVAGMHLYAQWPAGMEDEPVTCVMGKVALPVEWERHDDEPVAVDERLWFVAPCGGRDFLMEDGGWTFPGRRPPGVRDPTAPTRCRNPKWATCRPSPRSSFEASSAAARPSRSWMRTATLPTRTSQPGEPPPAVSGAPVIGRDGGRPALSAAVSCYRTPGGVGAGLIDPSRRGAENRTVRHVLTLFDDRVAVVVAVLVVGAAVSARPLARSWGGTPRKIFVAMVSGVLILAVTIVNRGIVVSRRGLAHDLTWWARHWSTLPALVAGDIEWWLKRGTVPPAGWAWATLTRRPGRTFIALVVASFAIETLHATVLAWAGDPTDLVANVLGAGIGVGAATPLFLRRAQGDASGSMVSRYRAVARR
ncbi:hypothetical protein BH24ACT5_BH24ACT5_13750 [soil metagenome]